MALAPINLSEAAQDLATGDYGDLDAGDHIAVDFVDGAFTFATTKRELAAVEAGPSAASAGSAADAGELPPLD